MKSQTNVKNARKTFLLYFSVFVMDFSLYFSLYFSLNVITVLFVYYTGIEQDWSKCSRGSWELPCTSKWPDGSPLSRQVVYTMSIWFEPGVLFLVFYKYLHRLFRKIELFELFSYMIFKTKYYLSTKLNRTRLCLWNSECINYLILLKFKQKQMINMVMNILRKYFLILKESDVINK